MGGRKASQSHWNINRAREKEVSMNVLHCILGKLVGLTIRCVYGHLCL